MSKRCEFCGKKPGTGNSVSHSHRKTKRKWLPNLQKIRLIRNDSPVRASVCAACIKSGKAAKP